MVRLPTKTRNLPTFALLGFVLAAAGCQSGDAGGVLGSLGRQPDTTPTPPAQQPILASELRAYCPQVTLREGTAFLNSYDRAGQGDPKKLIYQASIADVTRSCSQANGMMTINVAVAGKIVPGPLGKAGPITMPIRVAVVDAAGKVVYSQLHKYQVTVGDTLAATQFVFNDPNVVIPAPDVNAVQVFAGYDEGPPPKTAAPRRTR